MLVDGRAPVAGPEGVFVDDSQRPLFLPHIDEYLSGVQGTLTEWTDRSLEQVHCSPIDAAEQSVNA